MESSLHTRFSQSAVRAKEAIIDDRWNRDTRWS